MILDEIKANGWAIWPPISYSYDTINKDYPGRKGADKLCLGYPAPPPWASSAPLCDAPPDQLARFNAFGNTNWLGLDNQGRDVVARVIYGFRISVLFGLLLAMFSAAVGVTAGAVQGYFGGRTDLIFQRFLEIWSSMPSLFVLIIISSVLVPGLLDAARARCCCSSGSTSSASCAPSSCARATSSTSPPRARSGCRTARSCGSTCCPTRWWRR